MEPTSISQVSKLIFPFPATKTTNQVTFPQQFSSQRHLNKTLFLYKNINYETVPAIPSMNEILSSSKAQNVDIKLQTFGPLFRITAKSLLTENELGKAEGIIRVWLRGKILHMDSIRLKRETLGMEKSIFGIGLFIGAVAIRYGYDCGCKTAELLAINDSDLYHSKLVRFYKRIGFKVVHEVDGSSIGDMSHMLVWGGIGTRMDADIEELLIKWCSRDWGLGEQIIFPIHEYSILDVVYTVVQYKLSKNRRALTKGDVDLRFRNEAKISTIKIGNFNLTLST